jgi:glycosyltransferase involved in cell wall biosynthesis
MKICLAHGHVDGHSGSGRYITDLAGRLAEDGHEVTLVCHEHQSVLPAAVEVVQIPRASSRLWRLGHVAALASNTRHLRRKFQLRQFDVYFGSDLLFLRPLVARRNAGGRFLYAPLSMIAPIEIESYELGGLRGAVGPWMYARLQRWALGSCDRVLRFTNAAVRALERYYRMDLSAKALVSVYVSRGFDEAPGAPASAPGFERPVPRELLWVGRLVKSKNVEFLLRAAARLRSSGWVLNVCSDGPERPALEAQARQLGIADRVRFLGAVDDMARVYRTASLLLTGSRLEQYSLTIMEAYAFGVPCVGLRPDWKTVFNSNEDQIVDSVTGYVVGNEDEMASRVDALIGDEPGRQKMARAAFAMKQQGFSFESFYRTLSDAL